MIFLENAYNKFCNGGDFYVDFMQKIVKMGSNK